MGGKLIYLQYSANTFFYDNRLLELNQVKIVVLAYCRRVVIGKDSGEVKSPIWQKIIKCIKLISLCT